MSTTGVQNENGDKPLKRAIKVSHESTTTTYQQAPSWSVDNEYIRNYYRRSVGVVAALMSVFTVHNESANIWSHAIAFTFYAGLELMVRRSPNRVDEQLAPLVVYRLAGMLCFFSSSLFHTFYIVSKNAFSTLSRIDYLGILSFLGAGGFAFISIIFDEQDFFLKLYLIIGVLLGCCLFREIIFNREFNAPGYLRIRAMLFFCYAMCILVSFMHVYFLKGVSEIFVGFDRIFVVFTVGILCYALKLPECVLPGRFDLLPSHAFFHCLVFLGSWMYYCKLCNMIMSRKMR